MKVGIVEDKAEIRALIKKLLDEIPEIELVFEAPSIQKAQELLSKHQVDLLLLDIELEDGTSFELLEKINQYTFNIIFITSFEEYALKAFRYSAIDYITKPIEAVIFNNALEKAKKQITHQDIQQKIDILLHNIQQSKGRDSSKEKIIINTTDAIYPINLEEIMYLSADANYTEFFLTNNTQHLACKPLKEYDELLGKAFIRIHQSHLVNIRFIQKIDKKKSLVILKNEETLPISSRMMEKILKLMHESDLFLK